MRRNNILASLALLAAASASDSGASATPDAAETQSGGAIAAAGPATGDALVHVSARPLDRSAPRYPPGALAAGLEGWVIISYVVLEDGTVADPVIESSSGVRDLERSARRAVRTWRFEPATRNGKAVQQCDVRTRLVFAIDTPDHLRGATFKFRGEWSRIQRFMDQGTLDEALERTEALAARNNLNLYETARVAHLRAILHHRLGNPHHALNSVRAAAWGAGFLGDQAVVRGLLEAQLSLELQLGEYRRATETAEALLQEGGSESDQRVQDAIDELLALRDGPNFLAASGHIGSWTALEDQEAYWTHSLLRRQFGLEQVDGEIHALDIRCAMQRVLLDFQPGAAWKTQDDWGTCDVYIYGEPGTTFTLVEYPLTSS